MPPPSTTPQQRIQELERELATRERVYPQWVRDGRLTQTTADHRTQVLRDLLADYRARYPQLQPAPTLFELPPPKSDTRDHNRPRHPFD